jgi:hypothetical protein
MKRLIASALLVGMAGFGLPVNASAENRNHSSHEVIKDVITPDQMVGPSSPHEWLNGAVAAEAAKTQQMGERTDSVDLSRVPETWIYDGRRRVVFSQQTLENIAAAIGKTVDQIDSIQAVVYPPVSHPVGMARILPPSDPSTGLIHVVAGDETYLGRVSGTPGRRWWGGDYAVEFLTQYNSPASDNTQIDYGQVADQFGVDPAEIVEVNAVVVPGAATDHDNLVFVVQLANGNKLLGTGAGMFLAPPSIGGPQSGRPVMLEDPIEGPFPNGDTVVLVITEVNQVDRASEVQLRRRHSHRDEENEDSGDGEDEENEDSGDGEDEGNEDSGDGEDEENEDSGDGEDEENEDSGDGEDEENEDSGDGEDEENEDSGDGEDEENEDSGGEYEHNVYSGGDVVPSEEGGWPTPIDGGGRKEIPQAEGEDKAVPPADVPPVDEDSDDGQNEVMPYPVPVPPAITLEHPPVIGRPEQDPPNGDIPPVDTWPNAIDGGGIARDDEGKIRIPNAEDPPLILPPVDHLADKTNPSTAPYRLEHVTTGNTTTVFKVWPDGRREIVERFDTPIEFYDR